MRQLQARIDSGEYSVEATDVADAILRHFRLEVKVARPDPSTSDDGEDE